MNTLFSPNSTDQQIEPGSKDGRGCSDNDQPYTFGRRPRGIAPFPFTTRQYARLLALRGRIADGLTGADDLDAAGISRFAAEAEPSASSPRLVYPCSVCGAVVAGAHQSNTFMACPKCAQDGGRDFAARGILQTAGVLD
jgi:hypothetical protein